MDNFIYSIDTFHCVLREVLEAGDRWCYLEMSQLNWTQFVFRALNLAERQMFSWTDSSGVFGIPNWQGDRYTRRSFWAEFCYYLSYSSVHIMERAKKEMLCSVIYSSTFRAGKVKNYLNAFSCISVFVVLKSPLLEAFGMSESECDLGSV